MQFANAGFLIAFLAGYYLTYHTIPFIGIGVSLVFMVAFSFFPETPTYLLRNKKDGVRKPQNLFLFIRNGNVMTNDNIFPVGRNFVQILSMC